VDAATAHLRGYDTILVPAVFGPWAGHLLDVVPPESGTAGLDVGTGPGTAARILASRIGPHGAVLGVDSSPAMLALAVRKPPPAGGAKITYRLSPAAPLKAPRSAFDIVVCQQVLQFVPDLHAALADMRRAARPGARLVAATWTSLEENPLFAALHAAVGDILGSQAASAFARPWSLPPDDLHAAADQAGWKSILTARHTLQVVIPSGPDGFMSLYTSSGVADLITALDEGGAQNLRAQVHRYLHPFVVRGQLIGPTTAAVLTAARGQRARGRRAPSGDTGPRRVR